MNLITPTWPAPSNIKAFTTTREGGVSAGMFGQFNLSAQAGEAIDIVEKNRALLKAQLALPAEPIWLTQVHGTQVVCADSMQQLQHTTQAEDTLATNTAHTADASFSQQPNTVCAILTADCLPLLLCNTAGTRIAAIHAGWRGLAAGIIETTLATLPTDKWLVWLGPAIGPRAFEIGEDARTLLLRDNPSDTIALTARAEKGKWLADLYQLARLRLNRLGINQVYGGDYCTYTQNTLFYSYRKQHPTGRMASLIWMTS